MYKTVVPKLVQKPEDAERMYYTLKLSSAIDLVCRSVVQGYYMVVGFSSKDPFTVKHQFSDARPFLYTDRYAEMFYSEILPPEELKPSDKVYRDKTLQNVLECIPTRIA